MAKKSFSQIMLACLLAGIIGAIVCLRIGHRFLINYIPYTIQIGLALIAMLAAIIYAISRKGKTNNELGFNKALAFWQGALRYFIALDLCMFGFQKICHLQFQIPLGILDNPFSSLNGDELVWAFFGRFYAFTVIIAAIQIIGSLMLLFRKTQLLAIFVLMPIMFNIILLDWFYDFGLVVNLYATLLTLALVYLLLTEYERLVQFFFIAKSSLPQFYFKSSLTKKMLRCSVIAIPVILLSTYKFPQYYSEINGKYEVKSFTLNGVNQMEKACRDSILTKVFIDKADFVLEYGNYRQRAIGNFNYNKATGNIKAVWHYPANKHDTLVAKISNGNNPVTKILAGRMGRQVFKIEMVWVDNRR